MHIFIIGLLGSIMLPIIPIPQIISIYRNSNEKNINISMIYIGFQIIANLLFCIYGLFANDYFIFIPNLLLVLENIIIILMITFYQHNNYDNYETTLIY